MRPLWLHSVRMVITISLLAVMSKGMDRAMAQQDGRSTPAPSKESNPSERNSNWNWYGNGVLVRPPAQDFSGSYAQPIYPPNRPAPQYREPPSIWEQPSNLRNDGTRTPGGQPVYKGPFDIAPPEKNRPWAEVPPLDRQGNEYGDRDRRERPSWPPQEGYRDYERGPRGYPPTDYPYGSDRGGPPPQYYEAPSGYWEPTPGRRGWDEYAPPYEGRDRGWDNWRPPVPYSNREYYPW
ncbi:MAG: hypothetical protein G8345_22390 [Magnetococcales bacterium]|nr:hypothetical protein [Magnetococcales bacterium]